MKEKLFVFANEKRTFGIWSTKLTPHMHSNRENGLGHSRRGWPYWGMPREAGRQYLMVNSNMNTEVRNTLMDMGAIY